MELIVSNAAAINRLHAESGRLAHESRRNLNGAMAAAWEAGRLLLEEKKRVSHNDRGTWSLWIEQQFHGSLRTAQRYMKLAKLVPEISVMRDLSLRRVYAQIGIATEPKTRREDRRLPRIPEYVLHANRLLRALNQRGFLSRLPSAERTNICSDLKEIHELLRHFFELNVAPETPPISDASIWERHRRTPGSPPNF